MADPVYDEEGGVSRLTPEALRNIEEKPGSSQNNPAKSGSESQSFEQSQAEDTQKEKELNQHLQDTWKYVNEADQARHDNQVGGGYKASSRQRGLRRTIQQWRQRKKLIAGTGAIVSLFVTAFILLLSFLNVFKLPDMMSNIDAKTFSRFDAAASRRSDKWIQSYLTLRLLQFKGLTDADPDSDYFRAYKVDTNNPVRDWYRTLRTSKFEADLARKNIVFANREASDANGRKFTFSVLRVDGEDFAGLKAKDVKGGKIVDILRTNPDSVIGPLFNEVDLTKPGGNREARRILKQAVNDSTRFHQVIQRRHVRKAIANMTGVRDWRFFEKTRDRVDKKKIDIRNKIVTKAIPESTLTGKFVRCFFGITSCRFSEDPNDPQYRSEAALSGDSNPDNQKTYQTQDEDGKAKTGKVDMAPASDLLKKIIRTTGGALNAANIVSTLDTLQNVQDNVHNHQFSKGVAVARGVQAMGLYQTFHTASDQMKAGELTGAEVNQFMKVIGPVSHGEGWTKVIAQKGDASKLTNTAESKKYCSQKNQAAIENDPDLGNKQFAYLCPDKQIGGSNNANRLEDAYNSSVGSVLGPILTAYGGVRNQPIIGDLLDLASGIINKLSGVVVGLLKDILDAVGLGDDFESAMQWVIGKIVAFLGAGPIMNGNEAAPVFANWLVQGGSYTAEATARNNGAAKTTTASKASALLATNQYQAEKQAQMSAFDKYLSLSNPESVASKQAFALSEMDLGALGNKLANIGSIFKGMASAITLPFNNQAQAASTDSYRAPDFAGTQTYDFPKQCIDSSPLGATPQNATNIQQVLGKDKVPDEDLTWDLVNNSEDWYQYVYDIIGDRPDADEIAVEIYNCNLIDTHVRGGLGYIYGYTKDNGLEDSSTSSENAAPVEDSACGVNKPAYGAGNGGNDEYSIEEMSRIFGDPGTANSHPKMDANLTTVDFLGHSVQVNKKAAACLRAVAQEIKQKKDQVPN